VCTGGADTDSAGESSGSVDDRPVRSRLISHPVSSELGVLGWRMTFSPCVQTLHCGVSECGLSERTEAGPCNGFVIGYSTLTTVGLSRFVFQGEHH